MAQKRCIFHIPNALAKDGNSASQLRPVKMIRAFRKIGYEVDLVCGFASQRRRKIREIENKIKDGIQYDFAYSESNTMPTLLTERHHLPTHPFLDFSFFCFLKKHGIKIGLFYRDIYWKFKEYREDVRGWKYYGAIFMYQYDLLQYNRLLSKLYLPTSYFGKFIAQNINAELFDILPSGCESHVIQKEEKAFGRLNMLYIGGIGGHYKIHKLLEAAKELEGVSLTVCCHEDQWKSKWEEYKPYMAENIKVVHRQGKGLKELYREADICAVFFEPDAYMKMAMSYKIFEYLGYGMPVIGTKGTATGEFIESDGLGWSIGYSKEELVQLLRHLRENPEEIWEKRKNCIEKLKANTWERRAEKVALDLR